MRLIEIRKCDQCKVDPLLTDEPGEYLVGDKILCYIHYLAQAQPPGYGEMQGLGALFG